MTCAEYINWILENPANFSFAYSWNHPISNTCNCHIFYTDPITGRKANVIHIKVTEGDENVIDYITGLTICKVADINFKLFNKYAKKQGKI